MARATGIGGVFFRARDPEGLKAWYVDHIGLEPDADGYVVIRWGGDQSGSTVWAPFDEQTEYFGPGEQGWMINYRVDDLDGLLSSLRERGVPVDDEIHEMPELGRFGWAIDPEGNRFELWEPAEGC